MTRNDEEPHGTPRNSKEHQGTLWNTEERRETPRNTKERCGMPWNVIKSVEPHQILWNVVKRHRMTKKAKKHQTIFKFSLVIG